MIGVIPWQAWVVFLVLYGPVSYGLYRFVTFYRPATSELARVSFALFWPLIMIALALRYIREV